MCSWFFVFEENIQCWVQQVFGGLVTKHQARSNSAVHTESPDSHITVDTQVVCAGLLDDRHMEAVDCPLDVGGMWTYSCRTVLACSLSHDSVCACGELCAHDVSSSLMVP